MFNRVKNISQEQVFSSNSNNTNPLKISDWWLVRKSLSSNFYKNSKQLKLRSWQGQEDDVYGVVIVPLTCRAGYVLWILLDWHSETGACWGRSMWRSILSSLRCRRGWDWTTSQLSGGSVSQGQVPGQSVQFLVLESGPDHIVLQSSRWDPRLRLSLHRSPHISQITFLFLSDFPKYRISSWRRSRGSRGTCSRRISSGTAWRDSCLWSRCWRSRRWREHNSGEQKRHWEGILSCGEL